MDHGEFLHFRYFNQVDTEVFHHLTSDFIKTAAPEGIGAGYIRKVYGVEEISIPVVEGSKVHQLIFQGAGILGGHYVPHDGHAFVNSISEITRGHGPCFVAGQ